MARKLQVALDGAILGKTVAVLGLIFKPKTDDMRDAPSIPFIATLQDVGAKVRVYHPVGMPQSKPLLGSATLRRCLFLCRGVSALVIFTEWEEFRTLYFARLKAS